MVSVGPSWRTGHEIPAPEGHLCACSLLGAASSTWARTPPELRETRYIELARQLGELVPLLLETDDFFQSIPERATALERIEGYHEQIGFLRDKELLYFAIRELAEAAAADRKSATEISVAAIRAKFERIEQEIEATRLRIQTEQEAATSSIALAVAAAQLTVEGASVGSPSPGTESRAPEIRRRTQLILGLVEDLREADESDDDE